jgi:predicted nucleic acid-binding protein
MGLKYIWDTNIVIYYLEKSFLLSGEKLIDNILNSYQPAISIITEIELLCWKSATEDDIKLLQNFISNSIVYELDQNVKLKAIEIRKYANLKLPDVIIAASALVNNQILISRNISDFNKISELQVIDPFNIG